MKNKFFTQSCLMTFCLSLSLLSSAAVPCYGAPQKQETAEDAAQAEGTVVEIGSPEELLALAENCHYDSWSFGQTVRLTRDLDLSGVDFDGIACFNGIFDGNGHSISNVEINSHGSAVGFFRYIGESGTVKNLTISGTVKPSGSQEEIGGIAGVNYGTISDCSFLGAVNGKNSVGAIAGINKSTGTILSCTGSAVVLATNETGGIAGTNEGLISECISKSSVNIEELEPTLDLGGVDLSSLNLTHNIIDRNDMGGIAGRSSGVIMECKNEGIVGYLHTGYNVGGIAGSQNGVVLNSVNRGKICGRKDVGGIAGQAEPYVESEYLEDKVRQTQEDVNRLSRTLNNISSTMSATSAQVQQYTSQLNGQYQTSLDHISQNVDTLKNSTNQTNQAAQGYVDNISSAMSQIDAIQSAGGALTEEQQTEIQNQLGTIHDNLGNLQGNYANNGQTAQEMTDSISNELQNTANDGRVQDIKNLANTVDNGMQSISNSMKSAVGQMNHISNTISEDLAVLAGDEEVIEDISSLETAENTDGVISGCINYGEVYGDLNTGGIAGTMNIEYAEDPEFDFNFRESVSVTLRSTVNAVIIHCINYGDVNVKRNYAGGIAGLQELGFIYDCEGYGQIAADSGSYLGGIAGSSAGTVEKSYSLCNVTGTDYIGGICGNGYTLNDNISISHITGSGERAGGIAGYLETEGTAKGNLFVSNDIHGIDNISYAGMADRISYDEVMAMDDIPEGFRRVTIVFETEDGVISETQVAYGGSISPSALPSVEEKEGCYVEWPDLETMTDIRKNLTVTAEYVPWTESISSEQHADSGKPVVLLSGQFYEGTSLILTEAEGPGLPDDNTSLAYAYSWELSGGKEKSFETLEAHLLLPEGAETAQVWVKSDNGWSQVPAGTDGSYLVATLPFGAEFAVAIQPANDMPYPLIAGAVLILVLLLFLYFRRKKRNTKPSA